MEDSRIIDMYFSRDENAIRETDIKYGRFLKEVSYNILRAKPDSEEIVNDTYLAAWNAIPPQRPSILKHFLSKITRNLSFNRLDYINAKRRSMYKEVLLSELEDCLPETRSPEEALNAKEIAKSLNAFLAHLDKISCGVFLSRYFYGRTHKETAQKYGISERQVKYILTRTRKALKAHLEKEGIL